MNAPDELGAHWEKVSLVDAFGPGFERVRCLEETHVTPWGSQQSFVYCLCRRAS